MLADDCQSEPARESVEFSGGGYRGELFRRYRWLPFVLPMTVFLLVGLVEPMPPDPSRSPQSQSSETLETSEVDQSVRDGEALIRSYPQAYSLRIFCTFAAILYVLPYYRTVPFIISRWAVPIGLLGGAIWIGICRLGLGQALFAQLGLGGWLEVGARAGFNPWDALAGSSIALVAFLVIRFLGLAVAVPLIEEFFLRGFFMRFFARADWWCLPLGRVTWLTAGMATLYGVLSHPAEPLAAAVWFSLITLMYARTRNIWDCVVAHAVTNFILGIYVLVARDWTLW